MKTKMVVATLIVAIPGQAWAQALQQGTAPVIGPQSTPVAQNPPAPTDDDPREIAEDAARDLTPRRFYNRPGATRADYDAAWQQCRLIARGSRTPSGSIPYMYNPSLISPVAASMGGLLGGLIAGAIAQGHQRRTNRQNCMLIRGWRLIEPDAATAAPVMAMAPAAQAAYLDAQLGAAEVVGKRTERTSFTRFTDPALRVDAPITGPGSVFLGKKVDPAVPLVLAPDEAAIVVAFRRADAGSAKGIGALTLLRYDAEKRDVLYRPRDWKATGDRTTYSVEVASGDRKAPYEVQVLRVTPGAYVLNATSVASLPQISSNCFGAPMVTVKAGEVAYLGDFIPYVNARLANNGRYQGLVYAGQSGDAATTLATRQPALAQAMRPATWRNQATYGCSGVEMTRFDIDGAEPLPQVIAAN